MAAPFTFYYDAIGDSEENPWTTLPRPIQKGEIENIVAGGDLRNIIEETWGSVDTDNYMYTFGIAARGLNTLRNQNVVDFFGFSTDLGQNVDPWETMEALHIFDTQNGGAVHLHYRSSGTVPVSLGTMQSVNYQGISTRNSSRSEHDIQTLDNGSVTSDLTPYEWGWNPDGNQFFEGGAQVDFASQMLASTGNASIVQTYGGLQTFLQLPTGKNYVTCNFFKTPPADRVDFNPPFRRVGTATVMTQSLQTPFGLLNETGFYDKDSPAPPPLPNISGAVIQPASQGRTFSTREATRHTPQDGGTWQCDQLCYNPSDSASVDRVWINESETTSYHQFTTILFRTKKIVQYYVYVPFPVDLYLLTTAPAPWYNFQPGRIPGPAPTTFRDGLPVGTIFGLGAVFNLQISFNNPFGPLGRRLNPDVGYPYYNEVFDYVRGVGEAYLSFPPAANCLNLTTTPTTTAQASSCYRESDPTSPGYLGWDADESGGTSFCSRYPGNELCGCVNIANDDNISEFVKRLQEAGLNVPTFCFTDECTTPSLGAWIDPRFNPELCPRTVQSCSILIDIAGNNNVIKDTSLYQTCEQIIDNGGGGGRSISTTVWVAGGVAALLLLIVVVVLITRRRSG